MRACTLSCPHIRKATFTYGQAIKITIKCPELTVMNPLTYYLHVSVSGVALHTF